MRERKLNKVLDFLNHSIEGAVLVTGGHGIGKSWFLEQIALRCSGTVVTISASPNEIELPLSGISTFLTAVDINEIAEYYDTLEAVSSNAGDIRVFAEKLLARLRNSELEARVILIDDLDGFDELSQEVLAFVFRRLGGTALRVVASVSTRPPSTLFTGLQSVTLSRLKRQDLERVIIETIDGPCAAAVICSVSTIAEGRPGVALALTTSLTREQLAGRDPLPLPYVIAAPRSQRILSELPRVSEREWAILSAVSTAVGVAQSTLESLYPGSGSDVLGLIDKEVLVRTASLVCFRLRYVRAAVYSTLEPCARGPLCR